MLRQFLIICVLTVFSSSLFAQKKQKDIDLQDYRYKHEASGGARIQTNGFTVFGEYGWIKDIYRTRLLQLEYTYYIDYRQKRIKAETESARDYLYGFQNKFHMIHLSYGLKRVIADKADRNGVRLTFVFFGGFSLGLLKPYYLEINEPGDPNSFPTHSPRRYRSEADSAFLIKDSIFGAAPIRFGLSQMEPVPGIHLKSALDFDWGRKDEFVKALEVGVNLDLFYKRLPIMINNHNRFYQISLFLSFQFGKRW